jgi:hypothetical protein
MKTNCRSFCCCELWSSFKATLKWQVGCQVTVLQEVKTRFRLRLLTASGFNGEAVPPMPADRFPAHQFKPGGLLSNVRKDLHLFSTPSSFSLITEPAEPTVGLWSNHDMFLPGTVSRAIRFVCNSLFTPAGIARVSSSKVRKENLIKTQHLRPPQLFSLKTLLSKTPIILRASIRDALPILRLPGQLGLGNTSPICPWTLCEG